MNHAEPLFKGERLRYIAACSRTVTSPLSSPAAAAAHFMLLEARAKALTANADESRKSEHVFASAMSAATTRHNGPTEAPSERASGKCYRREKWVKSTGTPLYVKTLRASGYPPLGAGACGGFQLSAVSFFFLGTRFTWVTSTK